MLDSGPVEGPPVVDHLYLEVTSRCNLNCWHCTVRSRLAEAEGQEPDADVLRATLSSFRSQGGRYVTLSGGEPGLRADLPELISTASDVGLSITLYSNGLAVIPSVLDSLLSAAGLLAISMDGPNSVVHETMRGAGTFATALDRLDTALNRLSGRRLMLSAVLSRPLLPHIDRLWEFVTCRQISFLYLDFFEPRSVPAVDPRVPTARELLDPVLWLLDAARDQKGTRLLFSESHDLLTAPRVFGERTESQILGRTVKVQADGWAFPGPFFHDPRFRLGKPVEQSWTAILNSRPYLELRAQAQNRIRQVPRCRRCFWAHRCGGGSLSLTWAFHRSWAHPCPLCELYEAALDRAARRQIHRERAAGL